MQIIIQTQTWFYRLPPLPAAITQRERERERERETERERESASGRMFKVTSYLFIYN